MSLVTDLREIERLHDQLLEQAMFGANNGHLNAAAPIPGGPATVVLSPWSFGLNSGADKAANEWAAEQYRQEHYADKWREETHPLLTLATWSLAWREWFHHDEPTLRITVRSASTYLRLNAEAMEHDHQQGNQQHPGDNTTEPPPNYDEMTKEIASVKATLENILYDGYREERSEVPCLDCPASRLVKRYHPTQTAKDHWRCKRCNRRYDQDAYTRAKHQHLVSEGAERFVLLQDAVEALRVPRYVIRGWLASGKVLWCYSRGHHVYVWWPHIRACEREQVIATARRKATLARRERKKRIEARRKKREAESVA